MSQDTLVLSDMLKLRQKSFEPLLFETISLPPQLIPNSFIAFGGYTIAVAIQAAFHSLQGDEMDQDQWSIYSIAGLFLGPTMLDSKLQYHVDIIRHTRSFQTRFITATQSNKGQDRKCLCVTIDFTRKMPSSGPPHSESRLPLCYTLSPHHNYPKVDDIKLFIDDITQRVSEGKVSSSTKKKYVAAWGRFLDIIDLKLIPGDVTYETLMGIVPLKVSGIKTRQQQEIADITK